MHFVIVGNGEVVEERPIECVRGSFDPARTLTLLLLLLRKALAFGK